MVATPSEVFVSFSLDDKISAPEFSVAVRLSLARFLRQV